MAINPHDFRKNRINDIQDLLVDAGHQLNRRRLRHPSYVCMDSNGNVSAVISLSSQAMGYAVFNRQKSQNYNVISFIKEHPICSVSSPSDGRRQTGQFPWRNRFPTIRQSERPSICC